MFILYAKHKIFSCKCCVSEGSVLIDEDNSYHGMANGVISYAVNADFSKNGYVITRIEIDYTFLGSRCQPTTVSVTGTSALSYGTNALAGTSGTWGFDIPNLETVNIKVSTGQNTSSDAEASGSHIGPIRIYGKKNYTGPSLTFSGNSRLFYKALYDQEARYTGIPRSIDPITTFSLYMNNTASYAFTDNYDYLMITCSDNRGLDAVDYYINEAQISLSDLYKQNTYSNLGSQAMFYVLTPVKSGDVIRMRPRGGGTTNSYVFGVKN